MIPRLLTTAALVLALALGALVATTNGVSSQGADPASVVHAYITAVNSHNVDAVLAVYADDAVHEAIPAPPGAKSVYIGKAQIRQFYQQTVVNHDHLAVVGTLHVVGDKVMYTKRIASDRRIWPCTPTKPIGSASWRWPALSWSVCKYWYVRAVLRR